MFKNISFVDFEDISMLISKTVKRPTRRVNSNLSFCFLTDVQEFTSFIVVMFCMVIHITQTRKIYLHFHLMVGNPILDQGKALLVYSVTVIQKFHLHQ